MEKPIENFVWEQKKFFREGLTRDIKQRTEALLSLKKLVEENQARILSALQKDLGKPPTEAMSSEIAFVINEITFARKNIKRWCRAKRRKTPLIWKPARSRICPEPKGTVLIIGPWNYPFGLMLTPLVGALAAGCTAILKPSEISSNSSRTLFEIFNESFDPRIAAVVEGGQEITAQLLQADFDHIFFTGSSRVGKIVMKAASRKPIPVTLELGGKNPCIVDRKINSRIAARRIAWGKFFNAGQTCVAPDYLLVHSQNKEFILDCLTQAIISFYGREPKLSPDYGRIINDHHFQRLAKLIDNSEPIIGGQLDPKQKYIAPTVLDNVSWDDPIMEEEIFGPILPVLEYDNLEEAIKIINQRPTPLAGYLFSNDKVTQSKFRKLLQAGGICINDTIVHILPPQLPFGGKGASGIGSYHGEASFNCFTHVKSLMNRPLHLDSPWRYPPYPQTTRIFRYISRLMR